MDEATRVAIVNAGGNMSLSAEAGDYNILVDTLKRSLERKVRDGKPLADVSVVRSTEDALEWVGHRGTIFYVTMGMAGEAEKVNRERSGIRVVVLSGEPTKGVVYLGKQWLNMEVCVDIALRS